MHSLEDKWRKFHSNSAEYTWISRKPNINSKSRLDRFYLSKQIFLSEQLHEEFLYSDHKLVSAKIRFTPDNHDDRGPGYYKINASVLQEEDYIDLIKQMWTEDLDKADMPTRWDRQKDRVT